MKSLVVQLRENRSNSNILGKHISSKHRRTETSLERVNLIITEIKDFLEEQIKIYDIQTLSVHILPLLGNYLSILYREEDKQAKEKLIDFLSELKLMPIVYLDFSDFDKMEQFVSNNIEASILKMIIKVYLPYTEDKIEKKDCPFSVFSQELSGKIPKRDIKNASNRSYPFQNKVSLWGGAKKSWQVYWASEKDIIDWANEYGFSLQNPSKEDLTRLRWIVSDLRLE